MHDTYISTSTSRLPVGPPRPTYSNLYVHVLTEAAKRKKKKDLTIRAGAKSTLTVPSGRKALVTQNLYSRHFM